MGFAHLEHWDFNPETGQYEPPTDAFEENLNMEQIYSVWANQGWREAETLAQLGDEILVEYRMPAGSTALRVINLTMRQQKLAEARQVEKARHAAQLDWTKRAQAKILAEEILRLHEASTQGRSVSYTNCPKKWLAELNRTGIQWEGYQQGWRGRDHQIPTPVVTTQGQLTLTKEGN